MKISMAIFISASLKYRNLDSHLGAHAVPEPLCLWSQMPMPVCAERVELLLLTCTHFSSQDFLPRPLKTHFQITIHISHLEHALTVCQNPQSGACTKRITAKVNVMQQT
uniref:Uncharacterized protein n=1 Tax=Sphaerodactylus townsendi TaxID=933632 RepID=A0ACB8FJJ8_9SAUR